MRYLSFPVMRWMPFCALWTSVALVSCDRTTSTSLHSPDGNSTIGTSGPAPLVLPKEITFNEHIQPILSENCYHCHGPDAKTRAPKDAPLRLDHEADAFAPRENGKPVIVKGNPDDSLLIKLIKSTDPDEKMPPPEGHKVLTARDIALLEEWVHQGAVYEEHWAFSPVKNPTPPEAGEGFARNPIDRFIAAKLEENGLKPNPPADPRRFYRRLSFDLTGLPPNPAGTEAFIAAHHVNPQKAVEDAAVKLLSTTASAEHFTRYWLDAARYGDSHGIHGDFYRSIWPYRDWVIRAFEANMPWDQFTIEQIAGDMLPNATLDQKIATGFNRCLPTTGEVGSINEEYEAVYAQERTEATSAVWLGLTTGCASCHDHKFDPLPTKEFYSLTAFFRNTTMAPMDGNDAHHPPNVFVPANGDETRWAQIGSQIEEAQRNLTARENAARPDYEAWLATIGTAPLPDITDALSVHLPLNEPEGPIHGTIDGQTREWTTEASRIDGPFNKALIVTSKPTELGDIGSFGRGDQVTYGGFIRIEGSPSGSVVARMHSKENYRGWDLYLEGGKPGAHVIDTWPSAANKLISPNPLTPATWHHVMVRFDGTQPNEKALSVYVDGVLQGGLAQPASLGTKIETPIPLRLGEREDGETISGGTVALQDFRFYRRALREEEIKSLANDSKLRHILSIPVADRTKEQDRVLFQHFLLNIDRSRRQLSETLNALKAEQEVIKGRGVITLVMEEKANAMPFAHVLIRGAYTAKGDKVEANTPTMLPPMSADAPRNRLGLAKWLVDPSNPLTSRVTMNRLWYQLFGTGIVETNEDFGIMGARPSHPRLLDWLSHEFVATGWDYRHMVKLTVTSAAYGQAETVTPEKLEKDPANRLISRGPRVRLDGEQLRDMALQTSGLLVNKVGGPPVKPYQPEGLWEAVTMPSSNTRVYVQDKGESLYRRSLYTFWKRTAAPPSMELFNAPPREVFCVRRDRTNTPLQALVMLNDPQFVEASRVLAAHALEGASSFDERLDFITTRLLSRTLDSGERMIVKSSFDDLLTEFRTQPDEAKKVIATGEFPANEQLDGSELAAWTVIASQVLNLDEAITR
jgi:hypothetical protein